MLKKIITNSLIIIFLIPLFSCEREKLKIIIVGNNKSDTLIFNSKDTLITHGILDSIMLISRKNHEFTINGSKPIKFQLASKEGILNTNKNEFILFNAEFRSDGTQMDPMEIGEIHVSSYVVIDSFLICEKRFENDLKDSKKLDLIIDSISISKNGNYKTPFYDDDYSAYYDEDLTASFSKFKKIGANNIFIEKCWDYNLNQEIPEQISVQTRSDNTTNYVQKRSKIAILMAKSFLRHATVMTSEYNVIDIKEQLKKKAKVNPLLSQTSYSRVQKK